MQFLKSLFGSDKTIIGLSGLRKKDNYVKIIVSENYKRTFIQNVENNYLLFN